MTKNEMMNELNEYGYNEENLYEIISMFYEVNEENNNTIEKAYETLKSNKINKKMFASMVNEYYMNN